MWKAGKLIKQIMKAYENCDLYVKGPYLRCIYNAEIMRKTYHAENLQCGKLIKQIMKAYENCDLYVKRAYLRCIYNAEITKNEPLCVQQFSK